MIRFDRVSQFYGSTQAINNLSFEVSKGEIVGLLGLNGAGKSTILKILACTLSPSSGNVSVKNLCVTHRAHDVRKLIGYLPDSPPLYPYMTVSDYLHFVARLHDLSPKVASSYVSEAMVKTGLEAYRNRVISGISYGYKQRVGLAQAIVHKPELIILDEPTNGLDPRQIAEVRDLIISLRNEYTVILSSHLLSEITKTCDRMIVISNGKNIAEGSEEELRSAYQHKHCFSVEFMSSCRTLRNKLFNFEAIEVVEESSCDDLYKMTFTGDVETKAIVAREIVLGGGSLLALESEKTELETLFMKIIATG